MINIRIFILAGIISSVPAYIFAQEPVSALGQPTAIEEPVSQEASELDLLLESLTESNEAAEAQEQTLQAETDKNNPSDDDVLPSSQGVLYGLSPSEIMAINPLDKNILEEDFTAKLRVIDRRINRHYDYQLKPLEVMNHHDMLLIQVVACLPRYNDMSDNDSVYIVASDNNGEPIYEGWIFSGTTSASALEHPSYSVLLRNCE